MNASSSQVEAAIPPRNIEVALNIKLGELLRQRHPRWTDDNVHAERTKTLRDHPNRKIDVLIEHPRGLPVAIETEFSDGPRVGREAEARLGLIVQRSGQPIEGAISIVFPDALRSGNTDQLETSELRYATHHLPVGADTPARWPTEPHDWLQGGIDDLADAVEHISLSERRIAESMDILEHCIEEGAGYLRLHAPRAVLRKIAHALHQKDSEQTTRMAVAIMANAFVFHLAIEGTEGIPSLASLRAPQGTLAPTVLAAWEKILEVNYWPVFAIARDLLQHIPERVAPHLLDTIQATTASMATVGTSTFHDLAGRMFQTLITDRKFLATFYTLPTSACLLAELATSRMPVDWSHSGAIRKLRIADFACGTGALLAAAQRAVARRHRRTGGDDRELHRHMMEEVLIATDIMPAATHLTASMLSSAHPGTTYGGTQVHTLPYGKYHKDQQVAVGALDLIDRTLTASLWGTGTAAGTASGRGSRRMNLLELKNDSCDLVIMNPPFTRPTNHESSTIPVPSFAGFDTSDDEMKHMSKRLRSIPSQFGHGNAGLGSNFMDVAHSKLKRGGTLAIVLPFSFIAGASWAKAREALRQHYRDIMVVSIPVHGTSDRAFSADTGMAECLLVATKIPWGDASARGPTRFTNVSNRPRTLLEAHDMANRINSGALRSLEGTISDSGLAAVLDPAVAETAQGLPEGRLVLPQTSAAFGLQMTAIGNIARRGLVDRDINGQNQAGTGDSGTPEADRPRGPFDIIPLVEGTVPTYPVLWNHHAGRERHLDVQPDRQAVTRPRQEDAANVVWRTASRLHHNRDFRLNSQSLAACLTPKLSLGGTAWPNLQPRHRDYLLPLLLWANSTLGLINFWWHGTRQQQGRARITLSRLPEIPALDVRKLAPKQRKACSACYKELRKRAFLPANEAYRDDTRQMLDKCLFVDILGMPDSILEPLDLLRLKWCSEPSVHGGKTTRPAG